MTHQIQLFRKYTLLFCVVWLLCIASVQSFAHSPETNTQSSAKIQLSAAHQAWLKNHPVIRIAIPDNVPAICMLNEQGDREGFLVDYFQEIQRVSGLTFEYHYMEVTESPDAMKRGEVDVIVTVRTREAEKEMNFTRGFFSVPFVIITRDDETNVTGRQWLAGKRVAALRNFATEKSLLSDSIPIEVVPVDSNLHGLQAVSFGQADAFLGALLASGYNIKKHRITNLKVAAESGYPSYDARLGARKDWPELIEIIDQTVEAIPNEQRNQMLDRWMSVRMDSPSSWEAIIRWVGISVGTLMLFLLVTIFWNRQLKRQVALRTHELEVSTHTLRESEERFRSTFEFAAVGMVHTSLQGIILRANQRFSEMLGYDHDEILGMHFKDVTYPQDLQVSQDYYRQLIEGESESCITQKRYHHKDGRVIWCNLSSTLHKDEQGQPLYFISVIEDITERFNVQQQLQQINNELQSVMDASTLALIVATDKEGVIQLYNSGAQRMLGYTADEVVGKQTPVLFHLEAEIKTKAANLSQKLGREIKGFEVFVAQAEFGEYDENQWTLVHKDGSHVLVNLGVTAIRDNQSQITGFLGVGQNISELIKAKEELAQKEENLRTTLNSIGDAVIATDSDGRIVQMNPVAEKLTGRGLDQAMGRNLTDVFQIINARTRQPMPNPVEKVLNSGEIVGLANHTILVSADRTEYQIADSGAPIRDDKNQIIGVVLVFRDVTTEYAMEHRLRETEKMNAIGQLAGGIAHDFNNMLGGILGSAELLEERLPDHKETRELFQIMVQSAQRAADLTSKLLTFSRKHPPQTSTLDVHQLLKDTVNILKQTIDRRIDIQSDFASEHQLIQGDLAQLQNVFMNLGINASHAMPDGGKIAISTKTIQLRPEIGPNNPFNLKAGPYISISVQDTGVGIDPDHLSHIFEPFFTTKDQGKGTGLGLATVFSTVKQHMGSITATSELGRGTCFTICLPLSAVEQTAPCEEASNQRVAGKGHILIVDDEKVMRVTAKAILEDLGYEVSLAEDGQIALDAFRENPDTYDLVVLDMMMPNLNGRDCFMAMKQIRPDIKVILSTGYTPESELLAMQAAGLTAWIKKPYMSGPLSQKIQEVLEQTE